VKNSHFSGIHSQSGFVQMAGVFYSLIRPAVIALGKKKEQKLFSAPPILIGGCARSGTTILLSVLSSHEDIHAFRRELGALSDFHDRRGQLEPQRIDRIYRTIVTSAIKKTATRWCEKSPSNITQFENIDRYFKGNFRFIHIVRDGRDVVLSRHPRDPAKYWVDPQRWVHDVSIGKTFEDHPAMHTIRYEDLITKFEETITGVCDFLGIEKSERIIQWHNYTTVKRNNAYYTKVKKLNAQSIGKWKQPEHRSRSQELRLYPGAEALLKYYNYL